MSLNHKPCFIVLLLIVFIALLFSCSYSDTKPLSAPSVPMFNKIVVVIGENEKPGSVVGDTSASYMNSILTDGVYFVNSFAIEHPSQPNYLDLISGSNQGIVDDELPPSHFTSSNLASELINNGKKFVTYSEDLPFIGFDGPTSTLYARKHNPVANWVGSNTNQVSDGCSLSFKQFPTNFSMLPDVSFVIPNLCNDGHDLCAPYFNRTKQFDVWIRNNLDKYRQWCRYNNSLLIITFDEDDSSGANKISTLFYGAKVARGICVDSINHFRVLRTIEEAMRLSSHAGSSASSKPITSCWQ